MKQFEIFWDQQSCLWPIFLDLWLISAIFSQFFTFFLLLDLHNTLKMDKILLSCPSFSLHPSKQYGMFLDQSSSLKPIFWDIGWFLVISGLYDQFSTHKDSKMPYNWLEITVVSQFQPSISIRSHLKSFVINRLAWMP